MTTFIIPFRGLKPDINHRWIKRHLKLWNLLISIAPNGRNHRLPIVIL
jgi:hypothetical protein